MTRFGGVPPAEILGGVIHEAGMKEGFIVHTIVSEELRRMILKEWREHNATTMDLMGPLLSRLTELLSISPRSEPGLFNPI